MSISRETIAKYYDTQPEEINCKGCRYGEGECLIECRLWSRIMGQHEFCSFWDNGAKDNEEET